MSTIQEVLRMARECGFTHAGELNRAVLEFLPAVRDMCAAGRCGNYGKSWTCPPGCGTLEEAPSMEAYGLLVSKVCEKSGLPYYYGPRPLAYTSCVLID